MVSAIFWKQRLMSAKRKPSFCWLFIASNLTLHPGLSSVNGIDPIGTGPTKTILPLKTLTVCRSQTPRSRRPPHSRFTIWEMERWLPTAL